MKLGGLEFGEHLLETNDLDPVYVILWEAALPYEQLCKWLVAYWMFYHVGIASKLSESKFFWKDVREALQGTNAPRGTERRHYRGDNAKQSYRKLRRIADAWCEYRLKGEPEDLIESLKSPGPIRLPEFMERVSLWDGFGPWISFKVADMMERLQLQKLIVEPADVMLMFDAPKKGAKLFAEEYDVEESEVVPMLLEHFGHYYAPPTYDRMLGMQEVETILCKYKSHCNGKYQLSNDIHEVKKHLLRYARVKTCQKLIKAGRGVRLWDV